MHSLCMSSKTISLHIDAYEKLRRAKRRGESFSDVVMRARWADQTVTATDLLAQRREAGPVFTREELDRLDATVSSDRPPEDKWRKR